MKRKRIKQEQEFDIKEAIVIFIIVFFIFVGFSIVVIGISSFYIGLHNVDLMWNALRWSNEDYAYDFDECVDVYTPEGDEKSCVQFYILGIHQMKNGLYLNIAGVILFLFGVLSLIGKRVYDLK